MKFHSFGQRYYLDYNTILFSKLCVFKVNETALCNPAFKNTAHFRRSIVRPQSSI